MIFNMTGGANPLNFKVVGNPKPANPKENTIWIDTDIPISLYVICPPLPGEVPYVDEGFVWIVTGNSFAASFNALKKNMLIVCPISAKQYIGGAWVNKPAEIYLNGAWVDLFDGFLYSPGNEYTAITGGWVLQEKQGTGYANLATLNKTADGLKISIPANSSGITRCANKIDLTNFNTLSFTVSGTITHQFTIHVLSGLTIGQWNPDVSVQVAWQNFTSAGTITLDISTLSGEYYVALCAAVAYDEAASAITVTEVKLT